MDLGKGLTSALQKFVSSRTIDEKVDEKRQESYVKICFLSLF